MKVVVSSSCRFSEDWPKIATDLAALEIEVYTPKKEELEGLSQIEIDRIMETVNRNFYSEIDVCEVLYIYCPGGYIGKGVASEIGYAIAKGKEVVASDQIDDLGIWSLVNNVMSLEDFKNYIKGKNV